MTVWMLVGCLFELDEDSFKEQFASVFCLRMQECSRGAFEAEYDADIAECQEDMDDLLDNSDQGDFDEDNAADCLEELRSVTCGDLYEDGLDDCDEVWD